MGKKFNSGLDKMINESVQQGEVDPQTGLEQVKPLKGKSLDDIIAENSDQSLQVDMSRTVGAEQLASGLTEEEWDFHDHAKARKRRAEEQGVLEQTGNVLARIVPKIAYGVIEQAGYLFDLEAHVDTVTGVGNDYSNFLTEWGQSGKKAMDEAFPIYRENPNSTFDLTDSGWWFENGEGLVESISEFMVTGAGVGKMFGGAARLIGQTMKSSAKMGGILTGTAELLTAAELAYVEGAMSGAEVYNEIYEIARAQGKSIEESKAQASKAAGTTVRLNTVINTALNASSAKMFVRPKGAASKLDASYKRGPNESMSAWRERLVNEASENGTKSGFATALAEAPKESLEEIVNEVASAVGKFKGRQAIGDLTIEDNETLFGEILETLGSDQTALAAILGGFGGLGQTALTSITPNAKERRRQEEDYRKRQLGYVVERVDSFQESQKKMAEALKNNDDAAYREATDEMFLSEAYSSIINGAEDHLSTLYDEIEQLSPEEAQKQGYDIDPDSPDYYKKRAKKAKEDIKKLSKDYANILSKYNSYDSEAAEVGYGEAVFLKHAHKNSIENKINDAQENLNNAKLRHAKDQELRGTDMDVMQAMETQDKIKASEKSIDDAIKELSKVEKRDGRSGRKQLERKYGKPPKGTTQKQHAINKINERIERIKKDREKNIDLLENQRKEFDSDEDFVQALKENTAARESIIAEQSAIDSARQYLKDLDKEYREFTSKEGRDKFVKEGQNELDKQRAEQRKNEEEAKAEQRRLKEEAKRAKAAAKAAKKAKKEAAKKGSDTDGKGVGAEPTSTEEGAGESVPSKAGDDSEIDEEKSGEEIIGEDNEEGDGDGSTEDVVEEGIGKSELSKPPIPSEDGDIANPTSGQSKKAYETKEATSTSERLVIPAGASFAYLSKEYVEVGGLKRTIGTKKADNLEKELESSKQFLPNQELTLEVDTNYTWKDKDGEIKSFDDFVNKDGSIDIENAPIAIKRDGKTIAHVRTKDWILAKKDGLYANVADSLDSKDPLYQNAERQAIINKEIRKKVFKSYLDGKGPLKTKVSKKSPGVLSINKVDGKVVRDTMSTLTPKQNTLLIVKNGNLHKSKSNIYTGEKGSSLLNTDEFLGSLSNYEGLVMAPFVAANGDVMIAPVAIPTLTDSQVDTMISVLEDPEAHKTAIFQDTGYDVSTPKGMLSFLRLFTHVTDSSAQEFGEAVNADGPASKMHFNYSTKTGKLAIAKHNREVKIINLKDVKGSRDAIKEILSKKLFSVRLSAINTSGNVVEPIIKDGKYDSKGYENYNEYAKSYLVTDIKGNEISDTEESYFDQPVIEYSDNFESEESTGKGAKAQPGGKPAKSEPATDTTADVEAKRLKELNDKLKPLKTKAESIVGNTPMDKLEKGDIQKEIKSIESEINSSPPVKIPDSLQGLVVTTPIHGKEQTVFTTQSLDRNVVFVQIDGKRYGFYQSTKGTDNKIKNHWYPFYGKANGWVVKDGGGKNWKYNSEASPELQSKLKDAADKLNKEYGKEQFKDTPYIHDTSEAEANELIGSQIKNAKEELFSGNKKAYDEVRKKTAEEGFKQPSRPALEAEPTTDTTTDIEEFLEETDHRPDSLDSIADRIGEDRLVVAQAIKNLVESDYFLKAYPRQDNAFGVAVHQIKVESRESGMGRMLQDNFPKELAKLKEPKADTTTKPTQLTVEEAKSLVNDSSVFGVAVRGIKSKNRPGKPGELMTNDWDGLSHYAGGDNIISQVSINKDTGEQVAVVKGNSGDYYITSTVGGYYGKAGRREGFTIAVNIGKDLNNLYLPDGMLKVFHNNVVKNALNQIGKPDSNGNYSIDAFVKNGKKVGEAVKRGWDNIVEKYTPKSKPTTDTTTEGEGTTKTDATLASKPTEVQAKIRKATEAIKSDTSGSFETWSSSLDHPDFPELKGLKWLDAQGAPLKNAFGNDLNFKGDLRDYIKQKYENEAKGAPKIDVEAENKKAAIRKLEEEREERKDAYDRNPDITYQKVNNINISSSNIEKLKVIGKVGGKVVLESRFSKAGSALAPRKRRNVDRVEDAIKSILSGRSHTNQSAELVKTMKSELNLDLEFELGTEVDFEIAYDKIDADIDARIAEIEGKPKKDTTSSDSAQVEKVKTNVGDGQSVTVIKKAFTSDQMTEHKDKVNKHIAELSKIGQNMGFGAKHAAIAFGPLDYTYGGLRGRSHTAREIPSWLEELSRDVEVKLGKPKGYYNHVLINRYQDSKGIGAHTDAESIYVDDKGFVGSVAIYSIGDTKTPHQLGNLNKTFKADSGSIIEMSTGKMRHNAPGAKGVRYSINFRHIPDNRLKKQKDKEQQEKDNDILGNIDSILDLNPIFYDHDSGELTSKTIVDNSPHDFEMNDEKKEMLKKGLESILVRDQGTGELYNSFKQGQVVDSVLELVVRGLQSKKSIQDSFNQAKAMFEQRKALYEAAERQFDRLSEEDKEKLAVTDLSDAQMFTDEFGKVLNNWEAFSDFTKQKLVNIFGIKKTLSDTQEEKKKDDDEAIEGFDEIESLLEKVSFDDGATFQTNHKDTASARFKLFLALRTAPKRTFLNLRAFIPFDTVYDDMQMILAGVKPDYDSFISELAIESAKKPYLKNILEELDKQSQQVKNEFVSAFSKQYNPFIVTLWGRKKTDNGTVLQMDNIESNRNDVIKRFEAQWVERQKISPIVKMSKGNLIINPEKAKEFEELRQSAIEDKTEGLNFKIDTARKLLDMIGVDMPPNSLEHIFENSDKIFKMSPTNMFKTGMFKHISKALNGNNTDDSGVESPLGLNNPLTGTNKEGSSIRKLASIASKFTDSVHSNSHRDSEGKTIYSYSLPSHLSHTLRRLKEQDGNNSKTEGLSKISFSKSSSWLDALKNDDKFRDTFSVSYLDGLNQRYSNQKGIKRGRQSEREMELQSIALFQNNGNDAAHFVYPTISDKTTTPIVTALKHDMQVMIDKDTGKMTFGRDTKRAIENLIRAEIDRIENHKTTTPKEGGILGYHFDKRGNTKQAGAKKMLLFPELNDLLTEDAFTSDGKILTSVQEQMFNKVESNLKSLAKETLKSWQELGIVTDNNLMFDASYRAKLATKVGGGIARQAAFAALDMELNYMIANLNTMQLISGDPALYFKNNAENTMVQYTKRLAKDIAPGMDGNFKNRKFNVAFAKDKDTVSQHIENYKKVIGEKASAYEGLEGTDAQELTTVQEHLTVMYAYGKLSDEDYTRLMEKADNEEDFDGKDLDTILQPQKPVFVNDEFNFELDVNKMTYIKSSSFPLLPQFTEGLELDAIRKDMLENGVDRLVYVSGAKLGATKIADIWDGNSIKKDFSLKENITTLDRDGFRIQQEVPYKEDKKKILTISQMNKLLFEGILDIKGMSELKARKDEIRIKLFEMGKDKLFKKLGIEVNEDTGEFSFKDLSKVQEALIEEAKSRNYPINDIQGLELTENKKGFILPLGFNASSKKFESILMSLVTNNVIKQKISGKSYVQGSSAGMLTGASKSKKWSELTDKDLGGIVFTQNADLDNGLKFARRNEETGATEAAQMIVPFYFRDKNGKPLKMSKYTKKVDGKTIIDPDKMDADLLKLVGARIPNQGHSSMLPIEIVGFLPESMGDLVIVPDEITAQMGSDFDVDKLYVYQYNYKRNKAGKLERVKHAVKQVKKEKVKFKKPVIKKEEEYISKSTKERIEESFGEDSYLMRTIKNNNGELTQSLASRIEMMLSNALDAYEANEQYTDISTGITFQSKELKLFINKLTDVYENTPVSAEEDFGYGIREKVKLPSGKVTLETQGRTITLNEQQTNAYVDMLDWHNNIDASEKTEITIQTSKGPKSYKANAYVLEGYAGTGKTTIIKKFLESVDPNLDNVSATAPTHKAKLQVKKTTGVKVYTVHKLLGLRPDTSVDNFSLATARFDQQNKPKIGDTDYVVIDEASMLNKELFNLVIGLASKYNTKIIFMGDPAQLPPIGERRSLVFDKVKEKSILSKVERQEKDNPLGKVYDAIRTNVNSPVDMFPHTDNIKDGKGIEFKRSRTEFEKEFGEALVKDPENVRAISYTNKAVRSYNKLARKYMFPVKEGAKSYKNFPFLPKEQLMFYGNIFYNRATGDYEYTNSEDVVVKSIERLEKDGYVGTSLTFETSPDKDFPGRPVFVLDDTEKNRRKFQKEVVELTDKKEKAYAISAKQGNIANAKLERFRDEHLVTWDVTHPTKKSYGKPFLVSEKKIDYGYALTSHKSQGSTFKEVFIDEADINSVPANPVDINKSKYVALSRPTDKATVMTNLPENAPVGKPDPNFKAPPAPTVKYRGGKPAEGSEQEAYPKQTSLIERGKAIGKEPTGKTTDNDPKEFVNHSGGAKGGDTAWDKIGREFGVVNHKHYREPGATKLDSPELKDAKPVNISKEDYEEGQEKATVAARQMGRIGNNQQVRSDYMIRNWAQVKYSDAVYAVGTIIDKGSVMKYDKVAQIPQVKGGTGYAVQMAINEGKPVYVYDGTKDSWFTWDGNNFSTTDTPTLTKNFAGIGSRSLSSDEVWKKSDQAIRDAYGKTFGEEAQTSLEEEFEKINEEGAEFTEEVDETLESLQNEYIDIHWDVLTHPEVLPRVLAPLDKRGEYSIDSEAKLINGIKSKNKTTKTPLYRRTQSEAFIQNRGGKSGVGQFSLASTFNSTIQSEDLRLGTMTKEGEQPIYISVFEGYQLRRLSGKGNNKNGDKASNIQDMQNASVDNANEQTLDKINLNDSTFLAANAIAQLEDDKGKNVTIQHISRLLSQKVIHDYVKELQLVSDSTVEGPAMTSEQKKSKAYANIREKYKEKSKGARATNTQLSPKNMLEMIKQEGSPTNEWFANQIVALDAFMNFDEVGHILTNIQSALNTDSKGVSPTYFQVEDKIHKVEKVPNNPMVRGTESLFGNDKEAGRATELGPYLAKNIASRFLPQGSRVIRESINTIMDYTFKDVLTVDQRQKIFDEFKAFAFASEHVFNVDPVKERKRLLLGGKEVRLPLDYGNNKKLVLSGDKTITSRNKNITSLKPGESGIQYVDGKTFKVTYHGELKHSQVKDKTGVDYSTGEAFAKTTKGEPTEDKTKKFIAGEGTKHIYQFEESTKEVNMSLARRVRAAQESWGANNFLLARINPKFAEIEGGADTLSYVASAGERLDESEATKGFIDLLTSDVAEERQLGEDLVKFSFLTSGTQGANNFIKFVPNKYLEIMGVSSQLRSFPWWDADMVDVGTFAEQFIRHNPYFAPGISEDVERYIQGNRIIVNTDPEAENNPFAEYMKLEINPSSGESDISMARFIQRRKDNQTELYEYFPTEQAYIKINTLGDRGGYSEYSSTSNIYDLNESVFNKTDVTSTLPKNTNKPSSGPEAFSVTNPNAFLKSVSDEYGITKKVDKEGKILTENILSKIGENSDRPSSRYFAKFLKSINDSLPNFSFTVDNNSGSAGSYGTGFTKEGKDGEIKTTNELVMNLSAFKSKLPRQGKSIFRKELFEETLLHELVHGHLAAYTRLAEVDPSKVPSKVMKALNSIEATRQMARRALPETMQNHLAAVDGMDYRKFNVYKRENNLNNREQRILYAFANIDSVNASSKGKFSHEYIVHVMTNPTVQAYLNTVEFEGSKSVFDRLVQVISDFLKAIGESLGVDIKKDSLLEEAVKNGFEVLTQTSTLGQGSITQADLDWNENTKYFGYNNANVVNSDILLTEKGKSILANQELRDIRKSFGLLKRDGKPKQLTSNQAKAKVKNLKTTNERFVKEYGSMYEPYVVFTPSSDKAYYNVGFRVKERSVPVQGVLFNHNVGFDNDSTVDPSIKKIIERIESRIRNIKKSMSKSKSDKVTFQEQIDKLENEIEKLTEENSLNSLAEVANEHLKWGEDVLNQEFVGVKELKDIENLINVWRDVKKIFKSDYSGKFKKVIGDISNRAEDLEVKFMDVNKALMLKEINNTGVEQTILDDLEVMKDSKVARSKLHDLSESGTNAASRSLDTWLKNAARDSGFEFLKFTKKMENMTKLLKSTEEFKRNKFNIFHQIKDGKWTGGLTNRYSLEYDIEYNAQLRKRDRKKGDPESWKNFFKWEKKNKIMIDTRLLFEEDGSRKSDNMFKKHVKELQDEFGEKRAEEMISQAEEKYMDYLSDRQSYIESLEARKEIQDDFNEEQYEAELKRWTLENSPKSYISSYFGQAIIKGIKMRGYKYTVSKPRKIIDGQDSGWYDKKYEQIENNPTLKEFYDFYKDTMAESLSHLPTYEIKDLKDNFIPNVKRSLVQRWTDGKMKGALSGVYEEIVNQISTSEKGAVSADRDMRTGRLNQRIPVRFLQDMDPEEKSTDMIKGLELFHMMALNYKHKSKIEDKVLLLQRIINEAVEQKVTAASQDQRDTSGSLYQVTDGMVNLKSAVQDTIDAMLYDKRRNEGAPTGLVIAKTLKDTVEASKLAKQIKMLNKDFELGKIDNIEHSKQTEPLQKRLDEIGGRNITTADVADTTMMITQLKGMAYNIFSAANNISFGLVGNIMHAAGGEDFSIKQSLKAYRMMLNATGKSIGLDRTGFGASAAKKILALMEIFDVMGEVNESKHKSAIASKKRTMLSKLSPYELQRRSEYFVQGQNMIAMMLNKKVTRLDGKETSLFEAFDENGQWKVAEYGADNQWDGDISSDKEMKSFRKFRNHLLQLNKRIHGNYDPNSFVPAKKAIFGRFALQFRSWFAEAVAMRFEPERPDAQLGRNVKGMYRTIGQIGPMKTMSAYLKIAMMSKNGLDEFSDVDKANLKKSFTELSFVIGVTIAGMLLSQLGDDDDDDKRVRNVLINQLYRLQSDLTFFMSPSSFDRILSNPVPAIRTYLDAEKALKAVGQYVMQDSELDGRKKLSGEEAMMKFLKAFPFLNQIPKAKTQSEKVLK